MDDPPPIVYRRRKTAVRVLDRRWSTRDSGNLMHARVQTGAHLSVSHTPMECAWNSGGVRGHEHHRKKKQHACMYVRASSAATRPTPLTTDEKIKGCRAGRWHVRDYVLSCIIMHNAFTNNKKKNTIHGCMQYEMLVHVHEYEPLHTWMNTSPDAWTYSCQATGSLGVLRLS
jgi:hypothetical protein